MKIKISSKILQTFPQIHYTVLLIREVSNARKVSSLSQLLAGTSAVAKNELKKANKKDLLNQVSEVELPDGSTFLESYLLSARIKKIQSGKEIDGSNNLLNFVNLISLKYFLPIHGFDLDQAEQDYNLEFYYPKKGKKTPELDFLPSTRHLALWFPNLGNWTDEEIDHFITEINTLLFKYLQTSITEVYHLDATHPEIDLGYESEKEQEFKLKKAEETISAPQVRDIPEISEQGTANFSNTPDGSEVLSSDSLQQDSVQATPNPALHPPSLHPSKQISNLLIYILEKDFPELTSLETPQDLNLLVEVETPKDPSHGDYSTNLAMKLAKSLGQSPQALATRLTDQIKSRLSELPILSKVETVGPGFINFFLSNTYFQDSLAQILQQKEQFGLQNLGQAKPIMIEFGGLNIAKPFAAHHFMTTVIGQTLVNLYRAIGYHVLSADFPGDWGTQFGKTIYAYKLWGDKDTVLKDPLVELLKLYVKFHEEAEKTPALEDSAREEFRKLEQGDQENLDLWRWMVDVSIQEIDKIYQTMGVKYDRRYPESKYNQSSQLLLQKGKDLGVFVEGEKGAFITNLDAENLPPAVVQKGDGTSIYITRDLVSIQDRLTNEPGLEQLIYVVDSAQTLRFKQLFAIATKLNHADQTYPITQFKHVAFGRMNFSGGMSTRKGNVIMALDLIKEGVSRSEKILTEKLAESGEKLSDNEIKQLTHGLAIGAIKYAMLTQAPESDFTFDWDKVLSFEGNSAPYLQYTYARSQSILRKAKSLGANDEKSAAAKSTKVISEDQTSLFSIHEEQKNGQSEADQAAAESDLTPFSLPAEQTLLRLLPLFPDKIAAAAQNYKPNILSNYLHDLAQNFNSFYGSVPVLKTQRPELLESRLDLVKATSQVIKNGLQILGIAAFEKM